MSMPYICIFIHLHTLHQRFFFLPGCVIAKVMVPSRPRTPHLMVAAQYDSWQLSHLVHGYDGLEDKPKPYTAAEQQYAEVGRIAGRMAEILMVSYGALQL